MNASVDPSRRYVLPTHALYLRNMAVLWAVAPQLAADIEALDEDLGYVIEPSKAGPPTMIVATPDRRRVHLHSRHQPVEEAKRLIDAVPIEDRAAFYIHGFGLGYHVEELFGRVGSETALIILEPDLLVLKTALQERDLTELIASRRLQFFWKLDKSELFARLTPYSALLSLGFEAVVHAPSLQLHAEFHRQMQTWIAEFAAFCRTSINTLMLNGKRTAENIARNVGWYVASGDVGRLKDRYKGKPAIIVSAGPSLRRNKHLLKEAQGRAVLVAVQTVLQPLLEMGVEPHFVTSLDYHDICTRFFEKLPARLRTELVAEPKATSKIFALNPGPLTILGNDQAEKLLREMRIEKPGLPAGATVAHLAFYLAEHLGCDPIAFVGQDLGFSDGLYYWPGTSYEDVWRPELGRFCTVEMKQWEQIVRERSILRRIPDIHGRPMYTEERLFTYLQQFERDFGRSRSTVIDASEGGALKRGTRIMTLAQMLEQYCREELPAVRDDHPGLRWDRLGEAVACLGRRRDEAEQVERISRETLPLLEEIRDHLDDQPRVNSAIARIDALRARMNVFGPTYDLITQLGQTAEMRRFQHDRRIAAAKLDGIEKQRRQVIRDIENVRAVTEAAVGFQRLMVQVIEEIETSQRVLRPAA